MKAFLNYNIFSKSKTERIIREIVIILLSLFTFVVLSFSSYVLFLVWGSKLLESLESKIGTKDQYTYTSEKRDQEIVSLSKTELSKFLEDNIFFLYLNDSILELMSEDSGDRRKYVYSLRDISSLCPFAKYPNSREYIPEELNTKLTNIEELNRQFCDLMLESNNLMLSSYEMTGTDTEEVLRTYSKARTLTMEALEIRFLIEELANEILEIIE